MSRANTITVSTVHLKTGIVPMNEPTATLRLDAPAGLVTVTADCAGLVRGSVTLNEP